MNKQERKEKAYKAYDKVRAPAWKAYDKVRAPARKEYLKKCKQIDAEEETVCEVCGK